MAHTDKGVPSKAVDGPAKEQQQQQHTFAFAWRAPRNDSDCEAVYQLEHAPLDVLRPIIPTLLRAMENRWTPVWTPARDLLLRRQEHLLADLSQLLLDPASTQMLRDDLLYWLINRFRDDVQRQYVPTLLRLSDKMQEWGYNDPSNEYDVEALNQNILDKHLGSRATRDPTSWLLEGWSGHDPKNSKWRRCDTKPFRSRYR